METRACLKIAFRQMCVTICGRFDPNEGGVVGYVDRMRAKSPAKWGVHMVGMNFQTRSSMSPSAFSLDFVCLCRYPAVFRTTPLGGRLFFA